MPERGADHRSGATRSRMVLSILPQHGCTASVRCGPGDNVACRFVDYCDFCPDVAVRTEPFSGKPCCDDCFTLIIGGEPGDPPWRCGNAPSNLYEGGSVRESESRPQP